MAELKRTGRADRRRGKASSYTGIERRQPPKTTLTVYSQVIGSELQIFPQGPITSDNAAHARDALAQHTRRSDAPDVVLDLQKCTYLDTPGLALLFEMKKHVNAEGRAFYIQNPARAVLRMLNITQMARVFPIRNTQTSDAHVIPSAREVGSPNPFAVTNIEPKPTPRRHD